MHQRESTKRMRITKAHVSGKPISVVVSLAIANRDSSTRQVEDVRAAVSRGVKSLLDTIEALGFNSLTEHVKVTQQKSEEGSGRKYVVVREANNIGKVVTKIKRRYN